MRKSLSMSIPFGAKIPFVDHLGFSLEKFEGGESELLFAPRPEHLNSFDVTHGGAVMTFLDVIMATAARSVDPDMGVVTIEMKTTFMRPAKVPEGEKLVGKATFSTAPAAWPSPKAASTMPMVSCVRWPPAPSNT